MRLLWSIVEREAADARPKQDPRSAFGLRAEEPAPGKTTEALAGGNSMVRRQTAEVGPTPRPKVHIALENGTGGVARDVPALLIETLGPVETCRGPTWSLRKWAEHTGLTRGIEKARRSARGTA